MNIKDHPQYKDYIQKCRHSRLRVGGGLNTESSLELKTKHLQRVVDMMDYNILDNPSEEKIFALKEGLVADDLSVNYINSILSTLSTWYKTLRVKRTVEITEALSKIRGVKHRKPPIFRYHDTPHYNPVGVHYRGDEDKNIRSLSMLLFNYFCGVSDNEIQNAKVEHLDFKNFEVTVYRSKQRLEWQKRMGPRDWGGGEPVNQLFWMLMRFYLDGPHERLGGGDLLFSADGVSRVHDNTVRAWIRDVTLNVFGKYYHPHSWKHTRLTYLVKRRHHLEDVLEFSGHSDLSTLQKYTKWGRRVRVEDVCDHSWVCDLLDEVGCSTSNVRESLGYKRTRGLRR